MLKHQLIPAYSCETEVANHNWEVNYPHLDIKKHYDGKTLILWCLMGGFLGRKASEMGKHVIRVK
jgi:hypothetical protein